MNNFINLGEEKKPEKIILLRKEKTFIRKTI